MLLSLLFLPVVWIVIAAGRALAAWLQLPETATPLERKLIALGLGLGLLAYGVLGLGLLGLLYPIAGLFWVLALAGLGAGQHGAMVQELRRWRPKPWAGWEWGVAVLCAAFGIIALIGVYAPPVIFIPGVNATEWDSLSYHLADPKIFLGLHRIISLPWQSHSNFAFTAEMWYTLALMAHGYVPLAKWFSWTCAAGTTLAVYTLGARHLSPRVGLLAALLFASTPLIFGQAGTAYIDSATTFYITLALLCVGNGLEAPQDRRWLWAGAILAGFAVSTKASALMFFTALVVVLFIGEWRGRKWAGSALARTLGWGCLALIVGSPWYIKSWICTGNPVYPYFYNVFGGRWWSAHMAAAYAGANKPGPGHTLTDALLLPWNLTMALPPGHLVGPWPPFNEFPSALLSLSPMLLAALFVPAFGRGETPRSVKALAIFALVGTLLWFSQTQYVRFLMPLVPAFCLLSAWVLCHSIALRTVSGYALAALMAASLLWSLSVGFDLARVQAPVAMGLQSQSDYIAHYDGDAGAFQYINTQLPPDAKIVMFGHPLGFYCDRTYLWGDQSTYVLTPDVHSASALWSRLHALGVTHILVDTQYFPLHSGHSPEGWVDALTVAKNPPLYPGPSDASHGIFVYALPAHP
jgi:hypothetical protein